MVTTAPTASFTIPSTYDDTNLECRIYHPPTFSNHGVSGDTKWRKKGAVIAHAYAPLGGSLDDPIVHSAAEEVLKQGFVVGLFNFRSGHFLMPRHCTYREAEERALQRVEPAGLQSLSARTTYHSLASSFTIFKN